MLLINFDELRAGDKSLYRFFTVKGKHIAHEYDIDRTILSGYDEYIAISPGLKYLSLNQISSNLFNSKKC